MVCYVIGVILDELCQVKIDMFVMLKVDGEGFFGCFEDMCYFKFVKDYKVCYVFIMFIFDVVCDCFDQIEVGVKVVVG